MGEVARQRRPRRRGNGEGAIYQRASDGLWCGAVHLGYSEDGRRLRQVFTGKTRTEVSNKLHEALERSRRGLPLPRGQLTVADYLERWLDDTAALKVRESTLLQYRRVVRLHVLPDLGRIRLVRLTTADLQSLYRKKLESGLGIASVTYIQRVMHRALKKAVEDGSVARNVAESTELPSIPKSRARAMSVEEARAFIDAARSDARGALYLVAIGTGLRRGELLALQWGDVDLERGTIAVRRAMSKAARGWVESAPKTEAGERVVSLPAFALGALKAYRGAGSAPTPRTLVFATSKGTPIDGRNLLRGYKAFLAAAGIDTTYTFHSLRHSAATMMLTLGEHPKVVQEQLGHSRIAVTMDVYSHVSPHLQAEAARRLNALLTGPVRKMKR